MPNPVLNDKTFEKAAGDAGWAAPQTETAGAGTPIGPITDGPVSPYVAYRPEGSVMTRAGAYTATGVLLAILLVGGVIGWLAAGTSPEGTVTFPGWLLVPLFGAMLVAFGIIFRPKLAPFLGPSYAFAEGMVLGAISAVFNSQWNGIVVQAVGITAAVFAVMYFLYTTRIIRVTNTFRKVIIGATFGVLIFYGISLLIELFAGNVSYFSSASGWSIALSVLIAGIAAFNLMLDFDLIDRGTAAGAPRFMEWYAGFGLLVTLVWLYLEILRLLAKVQSR